MPRIRLLALDIDGTLVNSRNELTTGTIAALRLAQAAGIRIVLATGRRYRKTLPYVEPLAIDAPLVTASGALIKRPSNHETLFRAELPPADLDRLLQVVAAAGFEPVLFADTFHEAFDFYCPAPDSANPWLREYLDRNRGCGRALPDLLERPPPGVFGGFFMGSEPEMRALAARIEAALPGRLYLHVLRSPLYAGHMCEFAPAGVTKWSGICRLARDWRVAATEICAVGDDVNDLPMIRAAGLGVAMGNALPEVKAAAHRIAPPHDEDGLVQVVQWLLEHREA